MTTHAAASTRCANGHDGPPDAAFCSTCGLPSAPVAPAVPEVAPVLTATCPQGHAVAADAVYCPSCGSATVQQAEAPADAGWYSPPAQWAPVPPAAPRRRRTRLFVALGVGIALVAGGGIAAGVVLTATPTTTIHGTFELFDSDSAQAGCVGVNGYDDIAPGTGITVSDEKGTILGSGSLGVGVQEGNGTCSFPFTVGGVRSDAQQYVFEVSHRGKVVSSRAEMVANKWFEGLTLGD